MVLEKQDIEIGSTYDPTGMNAASDDLVFFNGKVVAADQVAAKGSETFRGYTRALTGISIATRLAQGALAQFGGTFAAVGNAAAAVIGIVIDLARAYLSLKGPADKAATANWNLALSKIAAAGVGAIIVAGIVAAAIVTVLALRASAERRHTGGRVSRTGLIDAERGELIVPANATGAEAGALSPMTVNIQVGTLSGDEGSITELVAETRRRLGGFTSFGVD